jgi:hypothetical protein
MQASKRHDIHLLGYENDRFQKHVEEIKKKKEEKKNNRDPP